MKSGGHPIGRRPRMERYWRTQLPVVDRLVWSAAVPAAMLYRAAVSVRARLWRSPLLARKAEGIRVISVGNLTVGGNAKTPFTLYLARKLMEQGVSTAIVSRGYGGTLGGGGPVLVSDGRSLRVSVDEAGDEAVMMARAFQGPVAIARRRIAAINLLKQTGPLDAVVLDDAYQHLPLARDLNLLLVNAERGFGNGWVLPAGPMREGIAAAGRADAVIMLAAQAHAAPRLNARQLARLERIPALRARIEPGTLVYPENGRWREVSAQSVGGRRVLAVSALADPASFYAMLRELEAELVGVLEYPDHYRYAPADWQRIWRAAAAADLVVTTEKDLVKLERFPFPRNSIAALRLEISMGADEQRLLAMALGADRSIPPAAVKGGAANGA